MSRCVGPLGSAAGLSTRKGSLHGLSMADTTKPDSVGPEVYARLDTGVLNGRVLKMKESEGEDGRECLKPASELR